MMRRLFIVTICLGFLMLGGAAHARGAILTPQDVALDLGEFTEDNSYSLPTRIVIVPLKLPASSPTLDPVNWYRGLYYFTKANPNRSGFTDIPFHYVVGYDGQVFEGNRGKDERKISIAGLGEDALVVGYLSNRQAVSFDPRSTPALTDLLLRLANSNAIKPAKIFVAGAKLIHDNANKSVRLEKTDLFGIWKQDLAKIVQVLGANYKPQSKTYKLKIVKVELPEAAVDSGSTVAGKITIKNNGTTGIYAGSLSEIIASRAGSSVISRFYLNGKWLSNTQFSLMAEKAILLPGQEATLDFTLATPLYFGVQQETFEIRTALGATIANSRFDIKLNIKRPQGTIVEIVDTPTGFLRVRSEPFGLTENEIARVSPGQRFFQTDTAEGGWVKIKLNDGKQGWVSRQYLRYV
jgi:hypothetical protein